MATTQQLISELVARFPEDADDLNEALELLQKQRLSTCDRLAKLNDSQWQRVGVPIGIEAILRDAIEALQREDVKPRDEQQSSSAPPPADTSVTARRPIPVQSDMQEDSDDGELPLEPVDIEGLRRRGGGNGSSEPKRHAQRNSQEKERKGLLSPLDLAPPDDLDILWQQLLEDTLPPDKRAALQESWEQTPGDHDKYMMFLEYSSYLRKPEITEEEKEERRKQLEPLMKEFGLPTDDEDPGWQGASIWCVVISVILFVAGLIYYSYAMPDPLHDTQVL
jgi:hypothetical protein|mmetsp:Transcript_87540/g.137094  ORF Transcript_87540/g.137094 Transcript_87540/m.137094 type:complete len:279 (-) Transcript_87540:47-883(-)